MLRYLPLIMLATLLLAACDRAPGQTEEDVYGHWLFDYEKTIEYREVKAYEPSDLILQNDKIIAAIDKKSGIFTLTVEYDTPIEALFELAPKDDDWFLLTVPETDVVFWVKPLRRSELLLYPDGYPEETMVMVKSARP